MEATGRYDDEIASLHENSQPFACAAIFNVVIRLTVQDQTRFVDCVHMRLVPFLDLDKESHSRTIAMVSVLCCCSFAAVGRHANRVLFQRQSHVLWIRTLDAFTRLSKSTCDHIQY